MKKLTKQHVAKMLLLVGGSSAVAESCLPNNLLFTQKDFAKDNEQGIALMPFSVYVDKSVNIQGVLSFVHDVTTDSGTCEKFSNNPESVLKSYGINSFDKNDYQLQLLMAMADKDIQKTIKEKDFTQYLSLLESKNLLQSDVIQQINYILHNETIKKQLLSATKSEVDSEEVIVTGAIAVAAVVIVAVALWVTVGVRLVAAIQWGAAVQALAEIQAAVHFASHLYTYTETQGISDGVFIEDNAINLFVDQSKDISTFELGEDEYVTKIRDFMLQTDELNGRDDLNTLFQLACGTTEKYLDNGGQND